jgi:WD40 repeat protein
MTVFGLLFGCGRRWLLLPPALLLVPPLLALVVGVLLLLLALLAEAAGGSRLSSPAAVVGRDLAIFQRKIMRGYFDANISGFRVSRPLKHCYMHKLRYIDFIYPTTNCKDAVAIVTIMFLAIGYSSDHRIELVDVHGGFVSMGYCEGHTALISQLAFSPDNCRLASAARDGTVRVWDVASREEMILLMHGYVVYSVCFNRPGDKILSSSGDYSIRVWDLSSETCVIKINMNERIVENACFSWSDDQIIGISEEGMLHGWSSLSGELLWSKSFNEEGNVAWFAVHPLRDEITVGFHEGKFISYASFEQTIISRERLPTSSPYGSKNRLYCVHYSEEGNLLACGGKDRSVVILGGSGEVRKTTKANCLVRGASLVSGREHIATALRPRPGATDSHVIVWHKETMEVAFVRNSGYCCSFSNASVILM